MRPTDDPLPDLAPEDHLHGVAAVLATGLRRLRDARHSSHFSPTEKESASVADSLALGGDLRRPRLAGAPDEPHPLHVGAVALPLDPQVKVDQLAWLDAQVVARTGMARRRWSADHCRACRGVSALLAPAPRWRLGCALAGAVRPHGRGPDRGPFVSGVQARRP
jgi:hypothetical protein